MVSRKNTLLLALTSAVLASGVDAQTKKPAVTGSLEATAASTKMHAAGGVNTTTIPRIDGSVQIGYTATGVSSCLAENQFIPAVEASVRHASRGDFADTKYSARVNGALVGG